VSKCMDWLTANDFEMEVYCCQWKNAQDSFKPIQPLIKCFKWCSKQSWTVNFWEFTIQRFHWPFQNRALLTLNFRDISSRHLPAVLTVVVHSSITSESYRILQSLYHWSSILPICNDHLHCGGEFSKSLPTWRTDFQSGAVWLGQGEGSMWKGCPSAEKFWRFNRLY